MNLILDVGSNMKWMIKINICLMKLNKILQINYTYKSLNKPMAKNILWNVTILFIYQRTGERGGLFRAKVRLTEGKNILQRK